MQMQQELGMEGPFSALKVQLPGLVEGNVIVLLEVIWEALQV